MKREAINKHFKKFLQWSEKYTKTDMTYLAHGGFWLSLTGFIASFITFLKIIFLGKFLPQEIYGVYSYIVSITGILAIFSLTGISTSIIKSIAMGKEGTFLLAIKTRIKWGLIGSILSLIASLWYFLNDNSLLGYLFLISGFFVPFINTFDISVQYFLAKKEFFKYAKYEILANIFISFLLIITVIFTNNIITIIIVFFASQFIFYGLLTKNILKNIQNKEEDKTAITFGKDLTLINTILIIAEHIDKIIIWKFLGPIQVAIYSFAQTPLYKINSLIPISTLALPRLGERNVKEIKNQIIEKFKKLFLISIPFSLFVIIFSPLFYKIFLPQYIESIPYFRFFAIIIIFLPFTLISSALISDGKKKELYIINIVSPLIKIALFIILIPFFGIWGIISSILVSQVTTGFLTLYFFIKKV